MTLLKFNNKNGFYRQPEAPVLGFSNLLDEFSCLDRFSQEFRNFTPRVNIREEAESFRIEVDAPGIDKNLLKMNISEDLLSLSYSNEEIKKDERFTYREFNYQNFERSFRLPDSVDRDKISASYRDGILLVELPKKTDSIDKGPRNIEIS